MFRDVFDWIKLVAFISVGFGIAFTVLMPGTTYGMLTARPFFLPWWGLLGDFDMDAIYDYYAITDYPTAFVMPVLMFVYMFVTTVVLVNLLIAQMSMRYESIMEQADQVWKAKRVALIKEYKAPPRPVPAKSTYAAATATSAG